MPLTYLLDEHLRGPLWRAIQWHDSRGVRPLDAVRVGDLPDLPLGTADPEVFLWAEREGRILVSDDRKTMASHLANHLREGHRSPGIFTFRRLTPLPQVIEFLVLVAYESEAREWQDRIEYFP